MKNFITKMSLVLAAILGVLQPLGWTFATKIDAFAADDLAAETDDADADDSDDADDADGKNEISDKIPEIFIKAINPGYNGELGSNVGEMIEIARKNADEPISLAGTTVSYTNSSGNTSVLLEFPEHSWFVGEILLLRLASSPDSELANETYTKTMAMSASLKLMMGEEVVDEACWTGKEGCQKSFKSAQPTTLARDLETGEWKHVEVYEPDYDEKNYYVEPEPEEEKKSEAVPRCRGLQFSEVLSYYETLKAEQFVELYNPNPETMRLDGCVVRYKNKNHVLSGTVEPEGYFAYYTDKAGFALTKNPTSSNELQIIDADGAEVDKMIYPNGQRKGTSYAWIGHDEKGEEIWRVTYAPTPGEPNSYQEFKTCESGKVLNKATGNCVKAVNLAVKTCKEGYFMNPITGRCNKVKTVATSECKAGYYRDPTTNRCRKIKENNGANYELTPQTYTEQSSFVALYAVLGVAAAGGAYLIYEFRHDIGRKFASLTRKLRRK